MNKFVKLTENDGSVSIILFGEGSVIKAKTFDDGDTVLYDKDGGEIATVKETVEQIQRALN